MVKEAWANLSTTGIGSLPPMKWEAAAKWIFSLDIPYLPTYPQEDPSEGMAAQLGLLGKFPIPKIFQGWLQEIGSRKPPWVKLQWPGPFTLWKALKAKGRESDFPSLSVALEEHTQALLHPLMDKGSGVLFFFDEPSLGALDLNQGGDLKALEVLSRSMERLGNKGVSIGLHCCGDAPWSTLMDLPIQVLSLDVGLSLSSLLKSSIKLEGFVRGGGHLALGLIPTEISPHWDLKQVCQELTQAFPSHPILYKSLLTPACGLGLRTLEEARQSFDRLRQAKELLEGELEKRTNSTI